VGTHSTAVAGDTSGTDVGNVAISLGDNSSVAAGQVGGGGFGNVATNLGNDSMVDALGVLNMASNTGGGKALWHRALPITPAISVAGGISSKR
jgi:hypothetical protein